jgi:hypothetical protein
MWGAGCKAYPMELIMPGQDERDKYRDNDDVRD